MLRIAICDDVPEHAAALKALLSEIEMDKAPVVREYHSAAALLEAAGRETADVAMLDVELGDGNGIELAKSLNAVSPDTQIIFMTSYPVYAADIYDARHVYFLVKPLRRDKVATALREAEGRIEAYRSRRVMIPLSGGETRVVPVGEIVWCERLGRTTILHCENGDCRTALKLGDLEALLPEKEFARPHNSFLVGLSHVMSIERTCVHLSGGAAVPVSNQKRADFSEALAAFI